MAQRVAWPASLSLGNGRAAGQFVTFAESTLHSVSRPSPQAATFSSRQSTHAYAHTVASPSSSSTIHSHNTWSLSALYIYYIPCDSTLQHTYRFSGSTLGGYSVAKVLASRLCSTTAPNLNSHLPPIQSSSTKILIHSLDLLLSPQ